MISLLIVITCQESLVSEFKKPTFVVDTYITPLYVHVLQLPRHVLQELEKDKNREIRELAREISSDIQSQVRHEQ